MYSIREHLADAVTAARGAVDRMRSGDLRVADDDTLVAVLGEVAAAQRLLDAAMVAAVEETTRRSDVVDIERRLTHRFGCASISELVQRVTRVSAVTSGSGRRSPSRVEEEVALSGELLPARLPALRWTVSKQEPAAADAALAASARRGDGPAPSADLLRIRAHAWAEAMDRDGAEPRDARMTKKRGVILGRPTQRTGFRCAAYSPRGRGAVADPRSTRRLALCTTK